MSQFCIKRKDLLIPCLFPDSDSATEVFRSLASLPLLKVDLMKPDTNPTVDDPEE